MAVEATADPWVEKNLRWNFGVGVVDAAFISFGLHLVSRETVIPLLVSQLTPSRVAIGFIGAIYSMGFYLPQLSRPTLPRGCAEESPLSCWSAASASACPTCSWGLPYGGLPLLPLRSP